MTNKKFLDFSQKISYVAGEIQKESYGKTGLRIEHKGRTDIVTEVDIKCEKAIIDSIVSEYPNHGILAEEGGGKKSDGEYLWIIDPLDGTTNYAHGFPIFCVSVALACNGQVIAGSVYDPLRDEMFSAALGEGATLNGNPIKVTVAAKMEEALIATGFPYDVKTNPKNNIDNFKRVVMECQAVRRPGSAAIDLVYVACGRVDAFWEQRLKPWDMAAGQLIVSEAGGTVTDMKGEQLDLYGETICVANATLHPQLLALLED